MKPLYHLIRKIIIISLVVLTYGYFCYLFFWENQRFYSMIYIFLFYVSVHYFFIEFRNLGLKYFLTVIATGTLLGGLFLASFNLFIAIGLLTLNIGIFFLLRNVDNEISNRRILSSWSIFQTGGSIFALFLALSYAIIFIAKNSTFTLTCDELYKNSSQFIDFISQPIKLGITTINFGIKNASDIKDAVGNAYNMSVKDFVGVTVPEDSGSNLSGDSLTTTGTDGLSGQTQGLVGFVDYYKNMLVDQVISNKRVVDKGVCNLVIDEIKSKYALQNFKFTVIALLFFLLLPFASLTILIISLINVLLFKFLRYIGVYKYTKKTEEIEVIE